MGDPPILDRPNTNIDDLVEITQLIIDRFALDNITLIGHSMGGLIALLLAEKYPSRIMALVSVEGNLSPDSCNFSRKIIQFSPEEWTKKEFPRLIRTLISSGDNGAREYAATLKKYTSPQAFYDVCNQIVDYSDNGHLTTRFIGLSIPKILLYGSKNASMRHVKELRDENIAICEISNSGHFPFYDNPENYYQAISVFLNRQVRNS